MDNDNKQPLTKGEFTQWATATKETLNSMDDRLASVEKKLDVLEEISTTLKHIREDTKAMRSLYYRMDWRTREMGKELQVDVDAIDARYEGPPIPNQS